MCGICGEWNPDGIDREALGRMSAAIAHRGPDDRGEVVLGEVGLAMRRLSIVDLPGGHQPMRNEDGTAWIVFNGEIYNHRQLRGRLAARGHRFRTVSDTEAILHAYEEYGTRCVDSLEGMFAFAIYDCRRHTLFMARDRLGKKPLFWSIWGDALHFGSEIKALAAAPGFDDSLDLTSLEGYLSLGYFLAPNTVYRHVRKLEPGHWLRLTDGQVTVRKYWDIEAFDVDRRPADRIVPELESALSDATRERLESEVPLGAFLSGGIDSALVVSFMAEAATEQVITTSVGFGESGHNELDAAACTARHLRTRHHPELVVPNLERVLDAIVRSFDEPFADASAIPTFYVSAVARQHVTVALSGDGGDEAFGGYDFRYVPHAIESSVARLAGGAASRSIAGLLSRRWPRSPRLPRALRLGGVLDNLSGDRAAAYYADLCFTKPDAARRLLGIHGRGDPAASPVFELVTEPYRRCPSKDPVQRAEYADLKVYLPNDVLAKVDRMSMAHGLEVRCPLLDRRVVEFAFRVPVRTKMARLRPKSLLRNLAARRLPPSITSLPKHGFTAPVREWLADTYAEAFRADVFDADALTPTLLDTREIRRLFNEHQRRERDHSAALWAVWMLERWARQHRGPMRRAVSGLPAAADP